jgi:hypothetical protein
MCGDVYSEKSENCRDEEEGNSGVPPAVYETQSGSPHFAGSRWVGGAPSQQCHGAWVFKIATRLDVKLHRLWRNDSRNTLLRV